MATDAEREPLQLWAGVECTVNRVRDEWFDQLRASGHEDRPDDLDRFAELGVQALRYPALWERISPDRPDLADFAWTDERLERLQALKLRPILGLAHHGAGPRYVSLTDAGFAPGLAAHAAAVARRYPWVEDYTPVNEPLTTARFSCLYGLWHPHQRDERAFWLALINQVDATRLAMRAIREVNPRARLVQTEDIGRTYSTAPVAGQAAYDNDRRWMSLDLLFGRVGPGHPLWDRLVRFGFEDRLRVILDDPCPPDIVGLNHYLTSDRFLDHRTGAYPDRLAGGNGRLAYADLEAIRVLDPPPQGLEGALRESLGRYERPVAITESHNGCTREEQLRWLLEAWRTAEAVHAEGAPVVAVTAWALLGSYNWASLLTRFDAGYESGVFDTRGGSPRRTALGELMQRLAAGEPPPQAALGPGWWRRRDRLLYRPVKLPEALPAPTLRRDRAPAPILITGATGTLGQALARGCRARGLKHVLTSRRHLPLDDAAAVERALDRIRPWLVINAAGWVRVDEAEREPQACIAANAEGAIGLARACGERDLPFVTFSSDLVFDGALGRPYVEGDPTGPLNVYGLSKAMAEQGVLASDARALVIRTAAFFSPFDPYNFAEHARTQLSAGRAFEAAADLVISPTFVPDLVDTTLDLAIDGETGLWHLANEGAVSWSEFAVRVAEALGLDHRLVKETPASRFGWPAARPAHVPLSTSRGQLMPPLSDALGRYARHARGEAEALVA